MPLLPFPQPPHLHPHHFRLYSLPSPIPTLTARLDPNRITKIINPHPRILPPIPRGLKPNLLQLHPTPLRQPLNNNILIHHLHSRLRRQQRARSGACRRFRRDLGTPHGDVAGRGAAGEGDGGEAEVGGWWSYGDGFDGGGGEGAKAGGGRGGGDGEAGVG